MSGRDIIVRAAIFLGLGVLLVGGLLWLIPGYYERIFWLLGKLHPIAVHLPIGMLVIGCLTELWCWVRGRKEASQFAIQCLWWGLVSGLIAVGLGWMNAWYQEFFGSLERYLFLHRWAGVAVLVLTFITICLWQAHKALNVKLSYYRTSYLVAVVMLGFTGHLGALLVHGDDYFLEVFFDEVPKPEPREQGAGEVLPPTTTKEVVKDVPAIDPTKARLRSDTKKISFSVDVHPLLQKHCKKCHGGGKDKGDFRIDSRELILQGGESGEAVVVGNAEESLLYQLLVETDHDLVMPQKGRLLYPEEVAVFKAWIDQGLVWGHETGEVYRKAPLAPRKVALPEEFEHDNPLDQLVAQYFKTHSVTPPAIVSDRIFVRRVYLDVVGRLPSQDEWDRALQDMSDGKLTRAKFVDQLLSDKHGYAKHWLTFWNDLLRNDYTGAGFLKGGRKEISRWLYRALLQNKPYDKFVKQLVAPTKASEGFVKGIVWQGKVNPNERPALQAAQNISQVFLGINLKCASCHDSFTDYWKLKDAYGFANVFNDKPVPLVECEQELDHVETARFLYPELGTIDQKAPKAKRLEQLAALLTHEQNGRFTRTIVNRIWKRFFGVGLIEPVDNMDVEPWSQDVLDWLANYLVEHDYDLKKLITLLLTSNTYQYESKPYHEVPFKDFTFVGPIVRKLSAEQLTSSLESLSSTWTQVAIGDLKRAFFMQNPGKRKPPFREMVSIDSDEPVPVAIDLKDADNVWLVSALRTKKGKASGYQKRLVNFDAHWSKLMLHSGSTQVPVTEDMIRASFLEPFRSIDSDEGEFHFPNFAVVRLDLEPGHTYTQLTGMVETAGVEKKAIPAEKKGVRVKVPNKKNKKKKKKGSANLEIVLYRDLDLYPSMRARDKVMTALGRPSREQVATTRLDSATTLQSLLLSNDETTQRLFELGAARLIEKHSGRLDDIAHELYQRFLGRQAKEVELKALRSYAKNGISNKEAVYDFMWATVNLPEAQLIF